MAIAGGGIPSFLVQVNKGSLQALGPAVNVPENIVQTDMVLAAAALREHPGKCVRIDAKQFVTLKGYLE